MGVFEFAAFAKGTYGVAETLADLTPKVRLPAIALCMFGVLHNPSRRNNCISWCMVMGKGCALLVE